MIEDAAQAIGARYHDRPVGSIGTMGCFSFFPSKNLGGAGDGGLITTDDEKLADRLRVLRTHGSRQRYAYELVGMNSRLDALQAAILRVKLRYLDDWTEKRRRNAQRYRDLIAEFGLQSDLVLPEVADNIYHVYNQFTIRSKNRDALRNHLISRAIPTEIYYPSPLHVQPAFSFLGYKPGAFPESERASVEVLSFPYIPNSLQKCRALSCGQLPSFMERSDLSEIGPTRAARSIRLCGEPALREMVTDCRSQSRTIEIVGCAPNGCPHPSR